jgi:sortase (surface protein transpeptidase)
MHRALAVTAVAAVTTLLPTGGAAIAPTAPPAVAPKLYAAGPAAGVRPVRVTIPLIGVSATVVPVPVTDDGDQAVPAGGTVAGWSTATSVPGTPGPAVLLGHVDGRTGPAVFFRLREVAVGSQIVVELSDGSRVWFAVRRVIEIPKSAVPPSAYGPTVASELRLVTCGGAFDATTGHYRDNVVVFADPSG